MIPNVPVKIRLMIEIDIRTPKGKRKLPYAKLPPHDQHAAKRELLAKGLSGKFMLAFLGQWEQLSAHLDDDYQQSVPRSARDYVQDRFDLANPLLVKELGFEIEVGEDCPTQICTKLPGCGHECMHCFELMKRDPADPTKLVPWTVISSLGVKANVMVGLGWSTPSMAEQATMAPNGGMGGGMGRSIGGGKAMVKQVGQR